MQSVSWPRVLGPDAFARASKHTLPEADQSRLASFELQCQQAPKMCSLIRGSRATKLYIYILWRILLGCWDFNFLATNGFSIKPLKVKLLAGEQTSQPSVYIYIYIYIGAWTIPCQVPRLNVLQKQRGWIGFLLQRPIGPCELLATSGRLRRSVDATTKSATQNILRLRRGSTSDKSWA